VLTEPPNLLPDNMSEVDISITEGLGVFPARDAVIPRGAVITEYPGPARWVTAEECRRLVNTEYTYLWGPRRIENHGHYGIIWEPDWHFVRHWRPSQKGHLLNTAHPQLAFPFSEPNCVWGLYFGPNFHVLNLDECPDVHLYVVAQQDIRGDSDIRPELLVDYHWQLLIEFGCFCGDYDCFMCYENFPVFLNFWRRNHPPRRRTRRFFPRVPQYY
jgi:hypothetical protein